MKSLMTRLEWLRHCRLFCIAFILLASLPAHAANSWEQPAAQLAAQVAEILGAGQAQLVVNNRSTIAAQELPAIRRELEQDLRARGVAISGAEGANLIRVTLSENARERLWVAEVMEGNRAQVTMVHVDREPLAAPFAETGLVLEKKRIWNSIESSRAASEAIDGPVLAALETKAALVVLEQQEIVVFVMTAAEWREEKHFSLGRQRASSRDARGILVPAADGFGFTAYTAGAECRGSYAPSTDNSGRYGDWTVHCRESDDPWPVIEGPLTEDADTQPFGGMKAFYNAGRNFFTGVVTPNPGVDLMPFYSIAGLPRAIANHAALLVNGIGGKVQLVEGNALVAVSGTRDWGSDFARVHTGCGAGTQVLASSSGEAENDSLRAYEVPAQDAVAVSAPIEMGGAVTALWTAPDGASVWTVVRKNATDYEVDRVTALCP
jgi:hypothetical protein